MVAKRYLIISATIFFFSFTTSTDAIPYEFISKICSMSPDNAFCLNAFGRDLRVRAAENLLAAEIRALEISIDKILDTLSYISLIRGDIADAIGQKRINTCTEDYKTAEKHYRTALDLAQKQNLKDMLNSVQEAKNAMFECENVYHYDPIKPSPISDYTNKALIMTEVVSIIYKLILEG